MHDESHSSSAFQLRLFGPFHAEVEGQPLPPLRTRKGQWLLALLALRHGREVQRTWLAATLWPDSLDEQAFSSLRRSLTDLRQALGPQAERLASPTAHTLRLDVGDAFVDVIAFDEGVKRGTPEALREAVALHRGPLLEGCTEEWALQEREEREQTWLHLLESLAEAAAQQGEYAEAIPLWRTVLSRDRLREGAQRGLMEALAGSGDFAALVQVYRELRLYLQRELRTEPAAETTALFQRLRSEGRARAVRTAVQEPIVAPPHAVQTVISASVPVPAPPHNLRHSLTPLIGRAKEVEEIVHHLQRTRLVCLTGSGGVGKTRLALEVAETVLEQFPEGVWFVELASLSDPVLVPEAVATALDIREEGSRSLTETLQSFLCSRRVLVVLDNCEHLLEACAELASSLLYACEGVRVLATSREPMGVMGERIWAVAPLSIPPIGSEAVEGEPVAAIHRLQEFDALRLFDERARAVQPAFRLDARSTPCVLQICRRLDGLPLAIELAAARVAVLDVGLIAERLNDRFRLLSGGRRTATPHQRTLQSLFDWSYDLLTPDERTLFRRLAVFVGGFTLQAAEGVCGCMSEEMISPTHPHTHPPIQRENILDLLSSLVNKSLVIYDVGSDPPRYRFLESVREYALRRLAEAEELDGLQERHREWYTQYAEAVELRLLGPEQSVWYGRLELEHDNLRLALKWSIRGEERLRLAAALWRFWQTRGHLREGRSWLEGTLRRSDTARPTEVRAKAANAAGNLARVQGDYVVSCRFYEESRAIREQLGDRKGVAGTLNNLGIVAGDRADFVAARRYYEQALAINREIGNRLWEAINLNNLGSLALNQGEWTAARAYFEQALALNIELGNRAEQAGNLNNLGNLTRNREDYETARSFYEQALALNREIGNSMWEAINLTNLMNIARVQEDFARAYAYCRAALAIQESRGMIFSLTETLESLAYLCVAEMRLEPCGRLLGAAQTLREKVGQKPTPRDRRHYERCLAAAHALPDGEKFEALMEEGRRLSVEQATAYAKEVLRETSPAVPG